MNIKGINRKTKLIAIISVLSLIVVFSGIAFLPCVKVLSLSNRKNPSEKVYYRSMENGFIISYTHSVNKGRVHDFYQIEKNGNLTVKKTVFVSYGAGIPEPEETKGAVFEWTNDGYQISGLNRSVPQLLMAVGVIAEHSISFDNLQNEFFLKDFFKPQTSVLFKVKKVSILDYFLENTNENRRHY